jgi:hypothetical protein
MAQTKKKNVAKFAYKGVEVEYDPQLIRTYRFQHRIQMPGIDSYEAFDQLLFGKSDEVADALEEAGVCEDGSAQEMPQLLAALIEKVNAGK